MQGYTNRLSEKKNKIKHEEQVWPQFGKGAGD